MQDTIVTMSCLCHDLLTAVEHRDDPQARLTSAQVMTVPLVAARFFGGNIDLASSFLLEHGYIQQPISKSRLNRRLHVLPLTLWQVLFDCLGELFKQHNLEGHYTIDSMPIPACDNIRIARCRLLPDAKYRGYCASKRRYFFGLKVHLLIMGTGAPVEFVLTPGAMADLDGFKCLPLELAPGAIAHGDRAYTDYQEEDRLAGAAEIILQSQRKANAKRRLASWLEALARPLRQRVETTFSQLEGLLPHHIRAVTTQGFVLKVVCFLLAVSFRYLDR